MRGLGPLYAAQTDCKVLAARIEAAVVAEELQSFCGTETVDPWPEAYLESSTVPFERDLLRGIQKLNLPLRVKRTGSVQVPRVGESRRAVLYRLESEALRSYVVFDLLPRPDGSPGFIAHVKILAVAPEVQGNFFKFRDFMELIQAALFEGLQEHCLWSIYGRAVVNQFSIRQREEWRNKSTKDKQVTKLLRLYQRVGAIQSPSSPDYVSLFSPKALAELKLSNQPKVQASLAARERLTRRKVSKPAPAHDELSLSI